jgi:flavin-dependent dehydrogenase
VSDPFVPATAETAEQPWDVLIAGAGPAGADLAWRLASAGAHVLLLDSLPDLRRAAFSSAALPWSAVREHGLPDSVVAARWDRWLLLGPGLERREWAATGDADPLGAVLDFAALRQWLARRAVSAGAALRLGWRVERWQPDGLGACTLVRDPQGRRHWLRSRWLVDATGQGRALIGDPDPRHGAMVSGAGVEWLLELPLEQWQAWAGRLSFLMGSDWVPQGYGWVFPMAPGQLKLGVCRLDDPQQSQPPLSSLLQAALQRLQLEQAAVLDRHGGLIRSTIRRREPHQCGPLLGLGDAVSTANLLGGEGIRHALSSSAVLAPLLLQALAGRPAALAAYPRQLRRRLGWRWSLSGRLARRTWLGLRGEHGDGRLRRLLSGLEATATAEDLAALLFAYRFERYGLRAVPYLLGWR